MENLLGDLLLGISALICGGFLVGSWAIYRSNGKIGNIIAFMLLLIAIELVFAMIGDKYIDTPLIYRIVKSIGRIIEGVGVGVFLLEMFKKRKVNLVNKENIRL